MEKIATTTPTILVIMGITGDLAKRKLLPAVEAIAAAGALPADFKIVGVTRRADIDVESLFSKIENPSFVREHLTLFTMDVNEVGEYNRLQAELQRIEAGYGAPAQRLFYLSVPPNAFGPIIEMLGTSGLSKVPHTKLLLEKPFGVDLASATILVEKLVNHFVPEQLYRIDHYLAKEMAQNLIVFRERNALFRHTWNKDFIERIEIIASEKIGIEGRVDFYEQTGALRDLIQSHLLQLAALTLMQPATGTETHNIPERRLAALKELHIPTDAPIETYVKRGQYKGYKDEVQNPESVVETFVSVTLHSDNNAFVGVPVTLIAGKNLAQKMTEVRIFYKKGEERESNELALRLQPDEGIFMSLWSKRPGYEDEVEEKTLSFTYTDHRTELREAYEKVFVDAMRGDHELFVSNEEVLESWQIIAPIQEAWRTSSPTPFVYEPGTDPRSTSFE